MCYVPIQYMFHPINLSGITRKYLVVHNDALSAEPSVHVLQNAHALISGKTPDSHRAVQCWKFSSSATEQFQRKISSVYYALGTCKLCHL